MWNDPIVEETRAAGAKLLAKCGGNLSELAQQLRANQTRHAHRVVHKEEVAGKARDGRP